MTRSEEAQAWFVAVYETVQAIPHGNVTSYGHIARLIDYPERSRQVGVALKHLPSPSDGQPFHSDNVPWQRVISSKGTISPRGPGEAARQAQVLQSEGVVVDRGSMGEYKIDLAAYGWFPESLED